MQKKINRLFQGSLYWYWIPIWNEFQTLMNSGIVGFSSQFYVGVSEFLVSERQKIRNYLKARNIFDKFSHNLM